MSPDPLADVLRQADGLNVRDGRIVESAYDAMARAARGHIAAEIEALADRLDAYDDNDGVGDPDANTLRIAAGIARGETT